MSKRIHSRSRRDVPLKRTAHVPVCACLLIVLANAKAASPVGEPLPDWVSRLAVQAYSRSTGRDLALEDLKLRRKVEYSVDPKFVQYVLSPTGDLVALRTPGENPQEERLWLAREEDLEPRLLTSSPWGLWWPAWSPSGDRIAFIQKHFDELAVYTPLDPTTDVRGFSLVVADAATGATREVTPRWYYAERYPESIHWSPAELGSLSTLPWSRSLRSAAPRRFMLLISRRTRRRLNR